MLSKFHHLVDQNLHQIVWALIATLMVLYGAQINQRIRRLLRPLPWVLRILLFVVICGIGYGWLSLLLVDVTVWLLATIQPSVVSLIILIAFVGLGLLAERRRMI